MTKRTNRMLQDKRRPRGRPWLVVLGCLLAMVAFTTTTSAETRVGSETCVECHDDVGETFATTAHGRVGFAEGDKAAGCEDCHGAGKRHADGDETAILNPATAANHEAAEACLSCHAGNAAGHWADSAHEDVGVGCADCHTVHAPWSEHPAGSNRLVTDSCLGCHNDMRKHLHQRSSHPLRDGQMSCASCHSPHGSTAEAAVAATTTNDKCYECHADKRGPYLFEHAPVREDCSTCHNPHGSNQTMLLTASPPRLCQSCHLFGHHQTVPGQPTQVWNQNRSCVNCHPRIHGSNHPSGVIFMR